MALMFTSKIAILRAAKRQSAHSSLPVLDWDNAVEIEVEDLVSLQPQSSSEGDQTRPQVITGWWLSTRAGKDLDLEASDRVVCGELVLSVVGDVARWPHPMKVGAVHHVEANLERVTG